MAIKFSNTCVIMWLSALTRQAPAGASRLNLTPLAEATCWTFLDRAGEDVAEIEALPMRWLLHVLQPAIG